jgi:hypothetical protein
MASIAVNVHRRDERLDLEADLKRARKLANLLDSQFSIGPVRFGLDGLFGLVPGFGDAAGLVGALFPLYVARKHRMGRRLQWRIVYNIIVDFLGGLLPIVGDLFDVYYKANLKNLALLEVAAAATQKTRAS